MPADFNTNGPDHDKINKMICAFNKDSDRFERPCHMRPGFWVAKDTNSPQVNSEKLIRIGKCPGCYESLLEAHVILSMLS